MAEVGLKLWEAQGVGERPRELYVSWTSSHMQVMACLPLASHSLSRSLPLSLPLCALHFSSSIFVLREMCPRNLPKAYQIKNSIMKRKIPKNKKKTCLPAPKIIYLLDELNFMRKFRWNFVYQLPPYYRPTHRSTLAMQTTCDIGAKMRHTHTHIHKLHTLPAYQKCKKCVRVCYFSFFFFITITIVLFSFWLIWQKSQTPIWPSDWLGMRHAHIALPQPWPGLGRACGAIKRRLFNENVFVLPKQALVNCSLPLELRHSICTPTI